MSRDLTGQVAIVTGAGRGIGRVMALRLASAGSAVGIVARSADELDEVAEAISQSGGRVEARTVDVTDRARVESAFGEIAGQLGPADLLVNNAGRGTYGSIHDIDPDAWWLDVEVNLRGPFLCSKAVLPTMRNRGAGRIVNIGSNAGLMPEPVASSYSCSKAALAQLTDSMALGLAPDGIRVFVVSPGMVRTRMMDEVFAFRRSNDPNFTDDLPETLYRPPELVADLVLRIAAGEADALSGRYITVDDDLDDMIARAEEIRRNELHVLRLRR